MEANAFRYPGPLMRARLAWLVVPVALALLAAGCGKSAADEKKAFLSQANKICAHFEGLQNQVVVPTLNPISSKATHLQRAQWGVSIKQLAYLGTQEVKALGKLKAPKDLADEFQALLTTKGGAFASMTQGAQAAERNHVPEIAPPIKASRNALAQATKQAKALGLKECE
jgi:hypothetical protein